MSDPQEDGEKKAAQEAKPANEKKYHFLAFSSSTKQKDTSTADNVIGAQRFSLVYEPPCCLRLECLRVSALLSLPTAPSSTVASFASCNFDLSGLKPKEEVTVDVLAAFASVIITVPRGARVDLSGVSVFARLDDYRVDKDVVGDDAPVVRIRRGGAFSRLTIFTELSPEAKEACERFGLERKHRSSPL